jgi:hypothetical protein
MERLADFVQLAVVEPDAGTFGAAVEHDARAEAVEFLFERDGVAARAGAGGVFVHADGGVAGNIHGFVVGAGVFAVYFFEFAMVEPDAAAAVGADIEQDRAGFEA